MNSREIKAIVTIPWADNENSWSKKARITNEQQAYSRVPLIFRALRLRCNSLIRVPLHIYEGDGKTRKEIDSYIFDDSLKIQDFLWLSEAALLLKGAAYILKLKNSFQISGRVSGQRGLQWLNPFTVMSNYRDGELYIWQETFTGERFPKTGYWTLDDFLYLREFSPTTDIYPGVSATQVALGAAQISNSTTDFLASFFGADAIPVTMVMMDKNTLDTERDRVQNWFRERLNALKKVLGARVLGVTNDIKIEKLTPELKSFEFEKIDTHTENEVANAFDIQKSVLLGQGANRAETEAHYRAFLDTTIIPRCRYYERILNPLLREYGQHIEFDPEEMSEYQMEETVRAQSLVDLVNAGTPLMAAFDILGFDLSEEAMRIIEEDLKNKAKSEPLVPVNGKQMVSPDGSIIRQ
jgi:HK97 family phage portal protein